MRHIGTWAVGAVLAVLVAVAWWALRAFDAPRRQGGLAPTPVGAVGAVVQPNASPGALDVMEVRPARAAASPPVESAPAAAPEVEAAGVRLCVVDPTDAPIAGARVRVLSPAGVPEQVTDAEGQCFVPFVPPSGGWSVVVEADGCFPVQDHRFGSDGDCIRLHPAGRLAGRVLERDTRAPIAGAIVWAPWRFEEEQPAGVTTDGAGRFTDVAIPLGRSFHLAARASGFQDGDPNKGALVVDSREREPSTEVLLERALVGELLVVDSESGEPVAGAVVRCVREEYATDAGGRVTVDRSLRPSDAVHIVTVDAQGHCLTSFELSEVGSASEPVALRLPRACSVAGLLRDARGEPLADVTVVARLPAEVGEELRRTGRLPSTPDSAAWAPNARWVRSTERDRLSEEDQGRFELGRLPAGLPAVDLEVGNDVRILATRRVGPLGPPGSRLNVDWQLAAYEGGGVRGRLLLNGEPHAGSVSWTQDEREGLTDVADDGVFVFEDLVPGSIELHGSLVSAKGRWGVHGSVTATVEIVPGEVARLDLACEVPVGSIRGTVSDAAGNPVAEVEVRLHHREDRSSFTGKSDADGAWSIRVADVPGTYRIQCARPLLEEGHEVRPGAEGVALHLLPNGRLRFRAFDASTGERLPAVRVSRLLPGGESRMVAHPMREAPDTSGWTEVDLAEGTHELGAWTQDGAHRIDRRSVRIAAEGVSEVEFRLEPAAGVTLRLDPEAGSLPADHVALLLAQEEWPLVTAELGARRPQVSFAALPNDPGRQRELSLRPGQSTKVLRLAPGRYRFKVFPDDVAITPEWIDVPSEGVVDVCWTSKP